MKIRCIYCKRKIHFLSVSKLYIFLQWIVSSNWFQARFMFHSLLPIFERGLFLFMENFLGSVCLVKCSKSPPCCTSVGWFDLLRQNVGFGGGRLGGMGCRDWDEATVCPIMCMLTNSRILYLEFKEFCGWLQKVQQNALSKFWVSSPPVSDPVAGPLPHWVFHRSTQRALSPWLVWTTQCNPVSSGHRIQSSGLHHCNPLSPHFS